MFQQQVPRSCSDSSLGIRRCVVYKNDGIKWEKFNDGFPNLFIEDVKNVTGHDGWFFLLHYLLLNFCIVTPSGL